MSVYRGTVTALVGGAPVVRIPLLFGVDHEGLGPLESCAPGLMVGDRVLLADGVDGRPDQFVVLGLLT